MNVLLTIFLIGSTSALKWKQRTENTLESDTEEGKPGMNPGCRKQPNTPTECGPNDRFSFEELRAALPEYKDIWARHPSGGKLSVNHQFAEWFLVKTLKPSHIVESGVLHGQATWALREAHGPDGKIFSLDPFDQTAKGFRDKNPNTKYITGNDWKDLGVLDWDALIPREDRKNTLVILDDHQSFYDRFKALKELGFRHVFVEDNNAYGNGNTSPNFFCTKVDLYNSTYAKLPNGPNPWPNVYYKSPWQTVNAKDQILHEFDPTPQYGRLVTPEEHAENMKYVQENMKSYFEFPAIADTCEKRPSLVKFEELQTYGLPGKRDVYPHRYPPYIEISQ